MMAKVTQRLDKVLANLGYGTRKEVKALVREGIVAVDGVAIKDFAQHINPYQQEIRIAGRIIEYREHIYLMMNKPEGVVSATQDNREETVIDLIEGEHRPFSPFPVGRLDKDTVGLLLITNDGLLAHGLLSPRRHIAKVYEARISGVLDSRAVEAVAGGVRLDDGYVTMPALLEILCADAAADTSFIRITVYEGKYHQVKRMMSALGSEVISLKRIKLGPLELDPDLEPGEYRELDDVELSLLKEAAKLKLDMDEEEYDE